MMKEQKRSNGWKTLAIIFITLFILETVGVIYLINLGQKEINKDTDCSFLCKNKNYDAYQYADSICYCYLDGEVVYHQEL